MIDTQTYTILIVEDNEGIARLMQINLERAGYRIYIAPTAWQARDYLKSAQGRVLMLLDYQLGEMSGNELLDQLEKLNCSVPFIVITGKGSEQLAVEMMKRGAADYIIKTPDLVDALEPLVAKVIEDIERKEKRKVYGTPNDHGRQT